MKQIPLSQGKFAQVDDEDFEELNKLKWYLSVRKTTEYAMTNIKTGSRETRIPPVSMHRNIMGCVKGDGKIVDHKDGNTLNNQKSNLRLCTPTQNCRNRRAKTNGTSKYIGVTTSRSSLNKRWIAQIIDNGVNHYLGYFKSEEEAAKAYNEAAKKYHGEFARLNVI